MRVGFFATCLVDLVRPRVGLAAVSLLEAAGCDVVVPRGQTCCGQPAYNAGARDGAVALARQTVLIRTWQGRPKNSAARFMN